MTLAPNMIVLEDGDNVGIALRDIGAGEAALSGGGRTVAAGEAIPQGHKIALHPIGEGERIVRLGVAVGIATAAIGTGRLVHIHNVRSQYLDNDDDHFE
jgi:altronate hydrolase